MTKVSVSMQLRQSTSPRRSDPRTARAARWRADAGRAVLAVLAMLIAAWALSGCQARTVIRAMSPDGQFVAVCRAIPVFDGPDFEVRLERPDGSVVRTLYRIGDGDACDEIAWAPDGQGLAILTGHLARVRFVDVAFARAHPDVEPRSWYWQQIDLSREGDRRFGRHLQFVGARELELEISNPGGNWQRQRLEVPNLRLPLPGR